MDHRNWALSSLDIPFGAFPGYYQPWELDLSFPAPSMMVNQPIIERNTVFTNTDVVTFLGAWSYTAPTVTVLPTSFQVCDMQHCGVTPRNFVNPESAIKHLYCAICQDVLEQPQRAPCGHSFCRKCILRWLEQSPTCPEDRRPLTTQELHHDFILDNIIGEQLVTCPYRALGCELTHPLNVMDSHASECMFNPCNQPRYVVPQVVANVGIRPRRKFPKTPNSTAAATATATAPAAATATAPAATATAPAATAPAAAAPAAAATAPAPAATATATCDSPVTTEQPSLLGRLFNTEARGVLSAMFDNSKNE